MNIPIDQLPSHLTQKPNSLTPDDRLFLAYLAAWILDSIETGAREGNTAASYVSHAKYIYESYKEQVK